MRRTRSLAAARFLTGAAAAFVLGGCATKSDIRDLQTELRALAARQDSLMAQLRIEMLNAQDTIRGQSAQLFDFRGELFRQLRDLAEGIDRVEALAGSNQMAITAMRDQLANLRRIPAGAEVSPGGPPGEEAGGQQISGEAEEIYNAAMSQYNRGSLATARAAFESFLQAYPTHALAPDARFYLADIMVQENRVEEALEAFREIPELFPTASKVPEALYRSALLLIELERSDEAATVLERIVNTYPGTDVANLAGERLREIR
jgi:tol-pal system protein YbgF